MRKKNIVKLKQRKSYSKMIMRKVKRKEKEKKRKNT